MKFSKLITSSLIEKHKQFAMKEMILCSGAQLLNEKMHYTFIYFVYGTFIMQILNHYISIKYTNI